ncbi:MAG: hypothetical protein IPM17_07890 [Verrucomicrobia bacterium]|nr:hypothetical protein [Verrucomicrobiota bacterium]
MREPAARHEIPKGSQRVPQTLRLFVALVETVMLLGVFLLAAAVLLPAAWRGGGRRP